MPGTTLHARLIRSDGELLISQTIEVTDPDEWVDMLGIAAAEQAHAALEAGFSISYEVMDPGGDLAPAGMWLTMGRINPDDVS